MSSAEGASPVQDGDEARARALAELASLSWKICEALERELGFAAPDRAEGGAAMLRFSRRRLEGILAGERMRIVTYEGQPWSAEIPASPINHDEIGEGAAVVDATVEPTVLGPVGILLPGKILLRKDNVSGN